MELISLTEWCRVVESSGDTEPVPQELKDLCLSKDEASRTLAAMQLPNYDRQDKFIQDIGTFFSKVRGSTLAEAGANILKWSAGAEIEIIPAFEEVLQCGVVYEGLVYLFVNLETDSSQKQDSLNMILHSLVKNGEFIRKFGNISGDFYCWNLRLTSLKNCPEKVDGNFDCTGNNLTNLEGAPQYVTGNFNCINCKLKSLEGGPVKVDGDFNCSNNKLINLNGSPVEVGNEFNATMNQLLSCEGGPKTVGGDFNCTSSKLKSLVGSPEFVGGNFIAMANKLSSLEGAPKKIGGNAIITPGTGARFTEKQIRDVIEIGGKVMC